MLRASLPDTLHPLKALLNTPASLEGVGVQVGQVVVVRVVVVVVVVAGWEETVSVVVVLAAGVAMIIDSRGGGTEVMLVEIGEIGEVLSCASCSGILKLRYEARWPNRHRILFLL